MTDDEAIESFRVRFAARPDPDECIEAVEAELMERYPDGGDDFLIAVAVEDIVRVFRRLSWVPEKWTSRYVWRLEGIPQVLDWLEGRSA